MTLSEYLSLFPGATREKPRFMALAEAVLRQAADLQAVIPGIHAAFSAESAAGEGLDAIAGVLGLNRKDIRPAGEVTDEELRRYLLQKLSLWCWDGTNPGAEQVIAWALPGSRLADNMDGTVTAEPAGPLPVPAKDLFPVAAGVRVIV